MPGGAAAPDRSAGPDGVEESLRRADAQILAALRANRPGAARALHARFAPQVNRLVWRTLADRAEHDDVVQDIFLAVIENIRRVKNPHALEGWVIQVTLHKVRSHIRARTRQRARVDTALDPEGSASTSDDHEGRDMLRRCSLILARFPENEARAFWLCHVDGRELAEVAALCDCSLSTAKRWLARAEDRFRRRVADDPVMAERLTRAPRRGP